MDERRFDRLAALCGAATSRRAGLAGLAAALGVLVGGAFGTAGAAGKRDMTRGDGQQPGVRHPGGEGPCGDGSAAANRCTMNKQCCTGVCDTTNRRCRCIQRGNACTKDRNCCNSLACSEGICTRLPPPCSPATCSQGCCDGTTCVTAATTSEIACGIGGAACVACSSSLAPACDAGTCGVGTWDYSAKFGEDGAGDSNFSSPAAVFVSADTLTAWVADTGNHRIAIWTRPDAASTSWSFSAALGSQGSGDSSLNNPQDVHVSADTLTAWVADKSNHRISIWSRPNAASTAWSFSATFGAQGAGDGNFSYPTGVFVSPDTLTAWVADSDNSRISIWTRTGANSTVWTYSTTFGTDGTGDNNLKYPKGVVASEDSLSAWVADSANNRVSIWTRPDANSTVWSYHAQFGTQGSGESNLWFPWRVFVAADMLTAWVADTNNSRVSVWTRPDAASTTWSPSVQFGTNGSDNGNFWWPDGVFVSANSLTTWVADTSNSRISIWTQG